MYCLVFRFYQVIIISVFYIDSIFSLVQSLTLLVKKITQMKSLQVMITSDQKICNSSTASISKHLHHINSVIE